MTTPDDATLTAIHGLERDHEQLVAAPHALQAHRDGHDRGTRGREIALAIARLEEARMWLHQGIIRARAQWTVDRRAANAP